MFNTPEMYQRWLQSTTDPEEIEKRIAELKVVRAWLEQSTAMVDSAIAMLDLQAKTILFVKDNPIMFNPWNEWLKLWQPK